MFEGGCVTTLRVLARTESLELSQANGIHVGNGVRGWNFRTRFSSALTAAPISFLQPANSCSSTTNNSRTSQNVAKSVRQNEFPCWVHPRPARSPTKPKPVPLAPSAAKKPPSLSSQPREGQFSAANVFNSGDSRRLRLESSDSVAAPTGRPNRQGEKFLTRAPSPLSGFSSQF